MAKRYSDEWKRNVADGVKKHRLRCPITEQTRKKLSEAAKKGNRERRYARLPTERLKSPQRIRERVFEERGRRCEECGWEVRNPFHGIIPVQVDHKDGDRTNNADSNLRVLCPNCHSLTQYYMFFGGSHKGTWGRKGTKRYR